MKTELLEILGLEVYTNDALYLGNVDNLVIDVDSRNLHGIYVRNTNPLLVENSGSVLIPFRWIEAMGDMVLLKHFPDFVSTGGSEKVRKLRKRASERMEP